MTKTYTQEQVDTLVANASRQMRDAAVKVCCELKGWPTEKAIADELADLIAALPILGEEK